MKLQVKQGHLKINSVQLLKSTKDTIVIGIDFDEKRIRHESTGGLIGGEDENIKFTFYFEPVHHTTDQLAEVEIEIDPSWHGARTAVQVGKYYATIFIVKSNKRSKVIYYNKA